MNTFTKSGYYYPNKFGLTIINALGDALGINGLIGIIDPASLPELRGNLSEDHIAKGFDFAELSSINQALEDKFGPKGRRGLALRVGRSVFSTALKDLGVFAGMGDQAFCELPLQVKLRIGLPVMAKVFSELSDQLTSVDVKENVSIYKIHHCPDCWGRSGKDRPICYIAAGLLKQGLNWISGGKEFRVNESHCTAMGDAVCEFTILNTPII